VQGVLLWLCTELDHSIVRYGLKAYLYHVRETPSLLKESFLKSRTNWDLIMLPSCATLILLTGNQTHFFSSVSGDQKGKRMKCCARLIWSGISFCHNII